MSLSVALRWFLIGSVVGTLCDRFHTTFGAIAYPHPVLFGQGWFVPFVMGGAGVSMISVHGVLRRRFGEPAGGSSREVVTGAIWFVCAYAATGLFDRYRIALTTALFASFVARAMSGAPSRARGSFAILCAAGGLVVERTIIALGGFYYVHPGLFGMAAWLPGLYLHTSLLARACERRWPVGAA